MGSSFGNPSTSRPKIVELVLIGISVNNSTPWPRSYCSETRRNTEKKSEERREVRLISGLGGQRGN